MSQRYAALCCAEGLRWPFRLTNRYRLSKRTRPAKLDEKIRLSALLFRGLM